MLTDHGLGIEYESSRWKVLTVGSHHLILVAGDYTVISYTLRHFIETISGDKQRTTAEIAEDLSASICKVRFEQAAKRNLMPLGVSFKAMLTEGMGFETLNIPDSLKQHLIGQFQAESLDLEAMVVGCDAKIASLLRVDCQGLITQHDDVGFLSIGGGGIHSSAYFMQLPYKHHALYPSAVLTTFLAKKRAEIAPGVGSLTDMFLITADGWRRLEADEMNLLERAYRDLKKRNARAMVEIERRLIVSATKAEIVHKVGAEGAPHEPNTPGE